MQYKYSWEMRNDCVLCDDYGYDYYYVHALSACETNGNNTL